MAIRRVLLLSGSTANWRRLGWSSDNSNTLSTEQRRFLLEYKPFIDFILNKPKILCRLDTYWDFDGIIDLTSPSTLVLSDGVFVIECYRVETKSLVEGFIRDWVLRFGKTWETSRYHFPSLEIFHLLEVYEIDDMGLEVQAFPVIHEKTDYSTIWKEEVRVVEPSRRNDETQSFVDG